jgi:hypothetical protein
MDKQVLKNANINTSLLPGDDHLNARVSFSALFFFDKNGQKNKRLLDQKLYSNFTLLILYSNDIQIFKYLTILNGGQVLP